MDSPILSCPMFLSVFYDNTAYNWKFVSITDFASSDLSLSNLYQKIIISPNMTQFGHIQIATETFRSAITSRYQRSSHIICKFIQNNETVDIFPG
jgi:hypothetical protein